MKFYGGGIGRPFGKRRFRSLFMAPQWSPATNPANMFLKTTISTLQPIGFWAEKKCSHKRSSMAPPAFENMPTSRLLGAESEQNCLKICALRGRNPVHGMFANQVFLRTRVQKTRDGAACNRALNFLFVTFSFFQEKEKVSPARNNRPFVQHRATGPKSNRGRMTILGMKRYDFGGLL